MNTIPSLGKPDAQGDYQVSRRWCAYVTIWSITAPNGRRVHPVPWSDSDLQRDQLQMGILQGHLVAGRAGVNEFSVTLVKNTKAHGCVVDKVRHFYRTSPIGKWRSA